LPPTTQAPPPSTLTPARPRASPMSARAPGRFSRRIAKSVMFLLPSRSSPRPGSNRVVDDGAAISPDQFDFARAPGFVEERLERAVESQDGEPALAGHRLDPVAPLDTNWLRRSEVDRRRAVGI